MGERYFGSGEQPSRYPNTDIESAFAHQTHVTIVNTQIVIYTNTCVNTPIHRQRPVAIGRSKDAI